MRECMLEEEFQREERRHRARMRDLMTQQRRDAELAAEALSQQHQLVEAADQSSADRAEEAQVDCEHNVRAQASCLAAGKMIEMCCKTRCADGRRSGKRWTVTSQASQLDEFSCSQKRRVLATASQFAHGRLSDVRNAISFGGDREFSNPL